jgi:hypothetical protein
MYSINFAAIEFTTKDDTSPRSLFNFATLCVPDKPKPQSVKIVPSAAKEIATCISPKQRNPSVHKRYGIVMSGNILPTASNIYK